MSKKWDQLGMFFDAASMFSEYRALDILEETSETKRILPSRSLLLKEILSQLAEMISLAQASKAMLPKEPANNMEVVKKIVIQREIGDEYKVIKDAKVIFGNAQMQREKENKRLQKYKEYLAACISLNDALDLVEIDWEGQVEIKVAFLMKMFTEDMLISAKEIETTGRAKSIFNLVRKQLVTEKKAAEKKAYVLGVDQQVADLEAEVLAEKERLLNEKETAEERIKKLEKEKKGAEQYLQKNVMNFTQRSQAKTNQTTRLLKRRDNEDAELQSLRAIYLENKKRHQSTWAYLQRLELTYETALKKQHRKLEEASKLSAKVEEEMAARKARLAKISELEEVLRDETQKKRIRCEEMIAAKERNQKKLGAAMIIQRAISRFLKRLARRKKLAKKKK